LKKTVFWNVFTAVSMKDVFLDFVPCGKVPEGIFHRLRVFENRVSKIIFYTKRDEVTGGWRTLHNEELSDLNSSPSIIRAIKSRRLRWARNAICMRRRRAHVSYWQESQRDRDHSEEHWICLAQDSECGNETSGPVKC
jgi:hypothetical protein